MNRCITLAASLCFILAPLPVIAADTVSWPLPLVLSDKNAHIRFEVDSTWHRVKGTTGNIEGRAWLEQPDDITSLRAEISVPVAQFDTDNSSRDEKLREVMAAAEFPKVSVTISSVEHLCRPDEITDRNPCRFLLDGTIQVRDVRRPIRFVSTLERSGESFILRAHSAIDWRDFKVEDPSIFVARLDHTVQIDADLTIPR